MAKRSRGKRPGQRRPNQRPAARPATAAQAIRPSEGLSAAEEARAAEIEASLLAQDRAVASEHRGRDRAIRPNELAARPRSREGGTIAASAAREYEYVVRDVRRIAVVAGVLFAVMVALFVLIEGFGVLKP